MHIQTSPFPSDNLMATEIDPKKTVVRPKRQLLNGPVPGENLHLTDAIVSP